MKTKDISFVLESMYECRNEMVPCFIGAPGIGKTQQIEEFAKSKGVKVVTFILSNTVPSEVSGIRMPDTNTHTLEVFDDSRMASLRDGDILFFDEILEAPPMLWSSILTLVQSRVMASGRILPDVFIVAASNHVASPLTIPPSVRDRFQLIELEFSFSDWQDWFEEKYGKKPPDNTRDYFQTDAPNYNIFTPRRFVKLWEYWRNTKDERKYNLVSEMFGSRVVQVFEDMDRLVVTGKMICNELRMRNIAVPPAWETMSIREIYQTLMDMSKEEGDEADNIIKILESIQFEEV